MGPAPLWMVPRWAAAMTVGLRQQQRPNPFVPLQPRKHEQLSRFQTVTLSPPSYYKVNNWHNVSKNPCRTLAPIQVFLSASCTFNHWSHPSEMLFVDFFFDLFFFLHCNPVKYDARRHFSPLRSSGPELLNYWRNTDVISVSGRKCILLKKK